MLREEKGLLQRELAEKLNLSGVAMAHYEQGTRFPERGTLQGMAGLFDIFIDCLPRRTENRLEFVKEDTGNIAAYWTDDPISELPEEAMKLIEVFYEFIIRKYEKRG